MKKNQMLRKQNPSAFEKLLATYDYSLPAELIATEPASPRDAAKLLVFNRKSQAITDDRFSAICSYLPAHSVLVLNETKVLPARFTVELDHRKKIPILFLGTKGEYIQVLAPRTITPEATLTWQHGNAFRVVSREGREALLSPNFDVSRMVSLLEEFGTTPLPPYIHQSPLPEKARRAEYQTVFARTPGSVAAPTAGLHFTQKLLKELENEGHSCVYVTLHVNLGTFAPLDERQWEEKRLHKEWFSIEQATIGFLNAAKRAGRPIVAVGTTVVRTLESSQKNGVLTEQCGATELFLTEGSSTRFVDHLITNFHVPKSSLMMLVSAFTGRQNLLQLYEHAMQKQYRFYSFGDAMFVR